MKTVACQRDGFGIYCETQREKLLSALCYCARKKSLENQTKEIKKEGENKILVLPKKICGVRFDHTKRMEKKSTTDVRKPLLNF